MAKAAGLLIASERRRRDWTLDELARQVAAQHPWAARMKPGDLSKIEDGENPAVAAAKFLAVCDVLGLDPLETWTGRKRTDRPTDPPASRLKRAG